MCPTLANVLAHTAHFFFFYCFNCSEDECRLAVTGRPVNEQWAASLWPGSEVMLGSIILEACV